jgi:hypothetical protein
LKDADDHTVATCDAIISGIEHAHEAKVVLKQGPSPSETIENIVDRQLRSHDRFNRATNELFDELTQNAGNLDILEIGSRRREATRSELILRGRAKSYVGTDIVAGPNVDIVADAHRLSEAIPGRQINVIYTQYVFEHLAVPWVVVGEMNKLLRIGGRAIILPPTRSDFTTFHGISGATASPHGSHCSMRQPALKSSSRPSVRPCVLSPCATIRDTPIMKAPPDILLPW